MNHDWKSSEFWHTLIVQFVSVLALLGFIATNDTQTLEESANKVIAAIVMFITNAGVVLYYIKTRLHLKTNYQNNGAKP